MSQKNSVCLSLEPREEQRIMWGSYVDGMTWWLLPCSNISRRISDPQSRSQEDGFNIIFKSCVRIPQWLKKRVKPLLLHINACIIYLCIAWGLGCEDGWPVVYTARIWNSFYQSWCFINFIWKLTACFLAADRFPVRAVNQTWLKSFGPK